MLRAIRPMHAGRGRAAPVRGQYAAGASDGRRGAGLPRGGGRRRRLARPRPTSALKLFDRQLALGRRAVLPAHRQARFGAKRTGGRRSSSSRRRLRCSAAPRCENLSPNYLVIGIEPDEGISLQFNAKIPGPQIAIDGVEMTFRYKDYFEVAPSTGYETLLHDCMIGDNILFQRADAIEAGWSAVQPFLEAWRKAGADGLQIYRCRSATARRRPTRCSRAMAASGASRVR
ncbi:MAG: hypothetical protein MZV49_21700 [Rhodopseudomonas palustris]|nr:hypothetical protein [Rhodopseudomonas palustris]